MGTCDRNSPGQSSLIEGGLSVVVRYIYTLRLYIRCDVAVKKLYVVRVAGVLANARGSSLPFPYLCVYFFLSLSRNWTLTASMMDGTMSALARVDRSPS